MIISYTRQQLILL